MLKVTGRQDRSYSTGHGGSGTTHHCYGDYRPDDGGPVVEGIELRGDRAGRGDGELGPSSAAGFIGDGRLRSCAADGAQPVGSAASAGVADPSTASVSHWIQKVSSPMPARSTTCCSRFSSAAFSGGKSRCSISR